MVDVIIDRQAGEIIRLVASVRPFVSLSVSALLLELFDLWPRFLSTAKQGRFGSIHLSILIRSGRYWCLALPSRAKVGRTKWLLFQQVAASRSITLLIFKLLMGYELQLISVDSVHFTTLIANM